MIIHICDEEDGFIGEVKTSSWMSLYKCLSEHCVIIRIYDETELLPMQFYIRGIK